MTITATLGRQNQNAFLHVDAESDAVAELLSGARKTEWLAADLDARQTAITEVAAEVNALRWRGEPLFAYQPFALPTDAVCHVVPCTAAAGSTATQLVASALMQKPTYLFVGGAVHLRREGDEEYGLASRVTGYDHAAGALDLADEFSVSLADKAVVFVTALPLAIRRALAIQAAEMLMRRDAHELAQKIQQGRTSATGDPGTAQTLRNVGGKVVWHPDAYWLLQPFLRRQMRAERET